MSSLHEAVIKAFGAPPDSQVLVELRNGRVEDVVWPSIEVKIAHRMSGFHVSRTYYSVSELWEHLENAAT